MTIKEAQDQVHDWITTIGVRYFDEMTNMAILSEEVGEVARIMSRTYGEQSFKNEEAAAQADLGDELADVLWVVFAIANQTGIDLEEKFTANVQKKTTRDKDRHKNNQKLG